jgi:hypothetical protein
MMYEVYIIHILLKTLIYDQIFLIFLNLINGYLFSKRFSNMHAFQTRGRFVLPNGTCTSKVIYVIWHAIANINTCFSNICVILNQIVVN